ncbi:N-acetylmuramic acid 6-phosphate etherase [Runella slithyformis]|uniref:N-acetylmuramic acid 6-phosphate etherase n=1 Tax=Runella slithyformis (strain ATCC 29530 / DSM 19594 / LMG 11500 / NCIMB 11436 / LSU 4) TaxID=761193 RepID=A0A7U4E7X6_RUNSL|nr:N-acetylmuramic acid 6-phosphate etherase [Runella slithyformis]AEI50654.1 N-acetylmuramic acid 6-phosphate etherase [Runella slithyformis DSM 19594]
MLSTSTTESASRYDHLDQMSVRELLININNEDKTVPYAVEKAIPQIEALVEQIVVRMKQGGRLFYIGAGTSGRLGVVDASECPPTYGVPFDLVIGLMAGGDKAIRRAVENAEDDPEQAWIDLKEYEIDELDSLVGIAASGRTPYVIGGLQKARESGILTGCIVCNTGSAVAAAAEYPVEIVVGPEFVTGSTRMKSGTAQKLALNMISTSVMIQLGRVKGNKMVDMQMTNYKLVQRAIRMVKEELPHLTNEEAQTLLDAHGSVRNAIEAGRKV